MISSTDALIGGIVASRRLPFTRYCEEFAFRYNNRIALGVNDSQRAAKIVLGAEGKRLTYKLPAGPSEN